MNVKPMKLISILFRNFSTKPVTNNDIKPFVFNRNPRNLEKMRIDRKPTGYPLEDIFIEFWHKLELTSSSKSVTAKLVHNTGTVVVSASTNEWAIYKHLYSKTDKLAHITVAKVFAERCFESGIYCFANDIVLDGKNEKVELFLKKLEDEGLMLSEMSQFDIHSIWYRKREKKPWTVLENE